MSVDAAEGLMTEHDHPDHPRFDFVVVANRLPVDRVVDGDGNASWRTSPGGLVTALEPVMRETEGAWIGWPGGTVNDIEPFDYNGTWIEPMPLSAQEVEEYYEGFSNDTLWPLYHDVIAPPSYHREWWDSYRTVNQRFAERAAQLAAHGATVWVHDYQLQLVPGILREMRPDVTIGFFNHIPFPAYGIYSQLPWRTQIIRGLLGADVIGFQRAADAGNFQRAVRRLLSYEASGTTITVPTDEDGKVTSGSRNTKRPSGPTRTVVARHYPISIDALAYERLAREPRVQERAAQIRSELGNPRTIMLGVDRLDYTKGIRHRLKAYGELLAEGRLQIEDVSLIQVASPSRERVETYKQLRDEIELTVGRINGDFGTIGHSAISYLHHGYPREEMVALFLAADIVLVTALRDGMNLVAKEYAAVRYDNDGVLVLSEFAGAADELKRALLVNPHDIEGLKDTIMTAVEMPRAERSRRMRAMRKRVMEHDVAVWSRSFLRELSPYQLSRGGTDLLAVVEARPGAADHA
ncbi:Alpha,alpha-trehalose-phosphate synthase [UDP-forming] [Mycetocola reblochoni REB411]|uniref:Alpha,alpha-trehalose-phosphate synthase [UDP-forming] n=2 Tax=Mycetocola reblochoni TaxID=331618 RepID=A0A1R4JAH5_9MICO|nr:Alpha,alpha-trehalose-phosphate synthase [UDP-forming] [Mycetocola reblochoni REB411]